MPAIIFLEVKTNSEKLSSLCNTIRHHYLNGDRIAISVQNQEAGKFIDQLLWKNPAESFLPHCLTAESTDERVAIVVGEDNFNHAAILINLRNTICPKLTEYEKIYEFYDHTSPEKMKLSEQKKKAYGN